MNKIDYENLAKELDEVRNDIVKSLNEKDAQYIKRVLKSVKYTEIIGRFLLLFGFFPITWVLGTLCLSISKIIDNMEFGHNVIHGQYNWMNDPKFAGDYEWDIVGTTENWRKTHNFKHHTYTNIKGIDDDIGYGVLRLFPEQKWKIGNLFQPIYSIVFALLFQWGIAIQELRLGKLFKGKWNLKEFKTQLQPVLKKSFKQLAKDYLVFPLLAGPNFVAVIAGNFIANMIRNVWTFVIIFCGHFTKKAHIFPRSILNQESKGHWYYRQILGSSNLSGGKWLHFMTGNLSHQIEHHLFPDIPSRRYLEISKKVREICRKYEIQYNTGNLFSQFSQVCWRIIRFSVPI